MTGTYEPEQSPAYRFTQTQTLDGDWILRIFVGIANDNEAFRLPVTLWTTGGVIYGNLAGGSAWIRALRERVRAGSSDGAADLAESLQSVQEAIDGPASDDGLPALYIHVVDAEMHVLGMQSFTMGVWRGRLSHIVGWTIGEPSASVER